MSGTIGVQVIRGQDFDRTIAAANKGKKDARQFMNAFAHWAEAMKVDGAEAPRCFSCREVVNPNNDADANFGGLAVGHVHEEETGDFMGFACPFCIDCEPKGFNQLRQEFTKCMCEELGIEELLPMQ